MTKKLDQLVEGLFRWRGIGIVLFVLPLGYSCWSKQENIQATWLLLTAIAFGLRGWTGLHLGPHGNAATTNMQGVEGPSFSGPYRWMRHPLYTANLLTAISLIGFCNCLGMMEALLLLALFFIHQQVLALHEENICLIKWPNSYSAYQVAVPRWPFAHLFPKKAPKLHLEIFNNPVTKAPRSLKLQIINTFKSAFLFLVLYLIAENGKHFSKISHWIQ